MLLLFETTGRVYDARRGARWSARSASPAVMAIVALAAAEDSRGRRADARRRDDRRRLDVRRPRAARVRALQAGPRSSAGRSWRRDCSRGTSWPTTRSRCRAWCTTCADTWTSTSTRSQFVQRDPVGPARLRGPVGRRLRRPADDRSAPGPAFSIGADLRGEADATFSPAQPLPELLLITNRCQVDRWTPSHGRTAPPNSHR